MTTENAPSVVVDFYGEEGQWAIAEGHVDLDAFEQAVRRQIGEDGIFAEDECFDVPPRHAYMRPVVRDDFDSDDEFTIADADGWQIWANVAADEPGAEPITVGGLPC